MSSDPNQQSDGDGKGRKPEIQKEDWGSWLETIVEEDTEENDEWGSIAGVLNLPAKQRKRGEKEHLGDGHLEPLVDPYRGGIGCEKDQGNQHQTEKEGIEIFFGEEFWESHHARERGFAKGITDNHKNANFHLVGRAER